MVKNKMTDFTIWTENYHLNAGLSGFQMVTVCTFLVKALWGKLFSLPLAVGVNIITAVPNFMKYRTK
jgi:hypothetical protein